MPPFIAFRLQAWTGLLFWLIQSCFTFTYHAVVSHTFMMATLKKMNCQSEQTHTFMMATKMTFQTGQTHTVIMAMKMTCQTRWLKTQLAKKKTRRLEKHLATVQMMQSYLTTWQTIHCGDHSPKRCTGCSLKIIFVIQYIIYHLRETATLNRCVRV
jgi:hypothetical protein